MKCKQYRERLEDWLDGELAEDQHAAVEEHGRQCSECALALAQRRALGAALKNNLQALTAGLHFQPRTTAELPAKKLRAGLHFYPRAVMALVAAAFVVLLFFFQPWAKLRQKSAVEKLPAAMITVSDSLNAGDESFISGRIDGFTYSIHLQVSVVSINDHS
jgi:anti-sigma factor RsiW